MNSLIRFGMLSVLGLVFVATLTGCAGGKKQQREINSLQAQVDVITDELVRMDEGMQDVRGTVQSSGTQGATITSQPQAPVASSAALGPIYRTPSGFELPATSIQQALKNAGYYKGSVDGKIGSVTKQAVKSFQRDHDLNSDGVVGRQTWSKLKVYLSGAIK